MQLAHDVYERYRAFTDDYLAKRIELCEYQTDMTTVLLNQEPLDRSMEREIWRFLNRLEEIRFTLPAELQPIEVERAILQLEIVEEL